ncbi:MAG: non-canonical purine NTP pyrophosphatase [Campylobacterota bacterium]|nr:non-canonical purine NTP pyrophosphatase [Campylobacterota bacterium]
MKIILASANLGKIKEIKKLLINYDVVPYSDILGKVEIPETGITFQENAIIKAKAVISKLNSIDYDEDYIVISDDSGISVPALNNEPNIYSARYAGADATDKDNLNKLIQNLQRNNIKKTNAYYTAALAIGYKNKIYTVHGWMYGDVIPEAIGDGGFGYDPIFIPQGYNQTLGELPNEIKKTISHRSKALNLAVKIINSIVK